MSEEPFPEIEKGVPIPPREGRTRPDSFAGHLRKMEVGDSIIVNQRQRNGAFASAHTLKIKLLSRQQSDGTIRIWRIE
jgi:hypothetical protein